MDKLASAEDALSVIENGMTVGIGGWGPRRKPMALVRALLRSDVRDLTVVAYGGSVLVYVAWLFFYDVAGVDMTIRGAAPHLLKENGKFWPLLWYTWRQRPCQHFHPKT